ncbi:PorV/PorQ family protein [Bacteroidales bacterium OttesenSCG-928-B11]|nr:PorV/PorQ family protein [Bacteroidales bacterium OttesenSCG-928-B11]MDL2325742.1 PorV/PorQ family protein [Bacteroidales bacterium OttesenSCG-928-A14]
MNNKYRKLIIVALISFCAVSTSLFAGNTDRTGQAGAQHLLIDPWAKSNGWGSAGVSEIAGLESIYSNVAGIARGQNTEFGFSRTQYLSGSDNGIGINSFGITQRLRKKDKISGEYRELGYIGISLFTMNFGEIDRTTVEQPEGNMGTFSPTLSYVGIHYAYKFNNYIYGGASVKIVSESISDLKAQGVAIDAGVQYVAGNLENFRIGVTLKNIGLPISYNGDGLSVKGFVTSTPQEITLEQRSAQAELPALLTLGLSYDFLFFGGTEHEGKTNKERGDEGLTRKDAPHRLTLAGSFTANSYSSDQFVVGLEYGMGYKEGIGDIFQLRAGYTLDSDRLKSSKDDNGDRIPNELSSWYTGPCAGVSFAIPLAKKKQGLQKILLDYGYRFTNKWKGNHYIGIKLAI